MAAVTADRVQQSVADAKAARFNRPELDLLRFCAFLGVFIRHLPALPFSHGALLRRTGAFGLSMFFLLSAYLITELLLRERDTTGTVSWRLFFVRRALRIWPLYYLVVLSAFLFGLVRLPDTTYYISNSGVTYFALFVTNWVDPLVLSGLEVAILWSISVEEQFYILWAPIAKLGGKRGITIASVLMLACGAIWICARVSRGAMLWFDTFPEFIYFAGGALIAVFLHGKEPQVRRLRTRGVLVVLGLLTLVIVAKFTGMGMSYSLAISRKDWLFGFFGSLIGCSLLFLSVLGLPRIHRSLAYLGKISYGLYVFHYAWILLFERTFVAKLRIPDQFSAAFVLAGALVCTVATAHLSYQLYEKKFLILKQRFEVVRSRPV